MALPTKDEIVKMAWEATRKTINKFREHPYYFFTESDIVSYFWQSMYSSKLEVEHKDEGKRIYLVHREYPTNFRYEKEHLLKEDYAPFDLKARKGTRGNFDLAVLNPEFVDNYTVEDIVNKNVRNLELRSESESGFAGNELLFALEFKYVINRSSVFSTEIRKDNVKLRFAKAKQAQFVVNLVFCNIDPEQRKTQLIDAVTDADAGVVSVFVQSYYAGNKKVTPRPITNCADADLSKKIGAVLQP